MRVGGKLVLFVLSERVAATWTEEHLIRLIINLKTTLPETATAATCLSVPFQEFQLLFRLLWKLTTLLPKEFIILTNICCSSPYGASELVMQTEGMKEHRRGRLVIREDFTGS